MIAIVDYGVGNLFSLKSSFGALGIEAEITSNAIKIKDAERIVLPGVGAFGDAAAKLKDSGLWEVVISQAESGKPLLGICLGMQLLLEKSYEFGCFEGLGLVPGEVRPIADIIPDDLKIPQMGWNSLIIDHQSELFSNTREGEYMYFVHSYYCNSPDTNVIASCEYGAKITAAVQNGNVYGTQFHPEKSGPAGLAILKAFSKL